DVHVADGAPRHGHAGQVTGEPDAVAPVGRVPGADDLEVRDRDVRGVGDRDAGAFAGLYLRDTPTVGAHRNGGGRAAHVAGIEREVAGEGGPALEEDLIARAEAFPVDAGDGPPGRLRRRARVAVLALGAHVIRGIRLGRNRAELRRAADGKVIEVVHLGPGVAGAVGVFQRDVVRGVGSPVAAREQRVAIDRQGVLAGTRGDGEVDAVELR